MSRPLAGLLIAILATFAAAPSTVFAAANTLADPHVSPAGGTAGTVITLAVSYTGSHGTDAVTASVGGRMVPLARVSGTARAGRWSGAAVPPIGTWPVVFSAAPSKGNQPVLPGTSITIAAAPVVPTVGPSVGPAPGGGAASAPAATAAPAPGSGEGDPAATQAPGGAVQPAPVAPSTDPVPVTTAQPAAGAGTVAPTGGNGAAPAPPSVGDPSTPSAATGGPGTSPGYGMPAASGGHASPSQGSAGTPAPLPGTELGDRTPWVPAIVTLGVTMAGLLALAGFAVWLAGRRRAAEETDQAGRAAASSASRAGMRVGRAGDLGSDDPIMGALGISPETALRARRARRLRDSLDRREPGSRPKELDPPRDPLRTQRRRTKRR